jgi:small conductance mechanosensitive channel
MLEDKAQNVMADVGALLPLIVGNTLNALGAILILLIGLWLSGRTDRFVVTMLRRAPHVDPMLQSFFGSLARYLVLTVTVLAVLSEFGIQTTSLAAILGAASLAVGLALQGTLSNLAAGVMLLIFRPFRIGHKVQIGNSSGTVKELSLFWTELVTDDKVQVIVPNSGVPRRRMRARYVFGLQATPSSTLQSNRCVILFGPVRGCSPTRSRVYCSTAARQRMRSRSLLHSPLPTTWRRS